MNALGGEGLAAFSSVRVNAQGLASKIRIRMDRNLPFYTCTHTPPPSLTGSQDGGCDNDKVEDVPTSSPEALEIVVPFQ